MHTLIYESMYKYAVLTDFVLCKCKHCVKKVSSMCSKSPTMRDFLNYLKTGCHVSFYLTVLVRLFTLNIMTSASKNTGGLIHQSQIHIS
ncbi:hypothetical protein TSAR_015287 [Trichomalopsis sarcophagae]|uniref:Uncharacterized protein n=1 Tax=Trichomalopsis sarcophagae TaxID=543379 RepID=A0A232EEF5_9HYME|nr:hypothetical protein TSAR_015287 [Trichomalopsis sarcophagae]